MKFKGICFQGQKRECNWMNIGMYALNHSTLWELVLYILCCANIYQAGAHLVEAKFLLHNSILSWSLTSVYKLCFLFTITACGHKHYGYYNFLSCFSLFHYTIILQCKSPYSKSQLFDSVQSPAPSSSVLSWRSLISYQTYAAASHTHQ